MPDFIDPHADSAITRPRIARANPVRSIILAPGLHLGKLTTIARIPGKAGQHDKWKCKCRCGKETTVRSSNLVSGKTTSCGCARALAVRKRAIETRGRKPKGGRIINQRWSDPTLAAVARLATLWDCDATQAVEIAIQYLASMAESPDLAPPWLLNAPAALSLAHLPANDLRKPPQ